MTETEQKLKQAAKLAGRGKISRREFTQLALASGLTLAAANTMFTSAARAEPKKGGTFKLGLAHGSTTDSMDPGLYPDQFTGYGAVGHARQQPDRNRFRRQYRAGSGRELRTRRRRQEVGLQAAQGHHIPQRQAGNGRRRRGLASCITAARIRSPPPSRCSRRSPRSRPMVRKPWSSNWPAATPTSPISRRTITSRSCRGRKTARPTGNPASAPDPTCSTSSNPA